MKKTLKIKLIQLINQVVTNDKMYNTLSLMELTEMVKKYTASGVDKKMIELIAEDNELNIERLVLHR